MHPTPVTVTPEMTVGALLALPEFAPIRDQLLIPAFFSREADGDVPLAALSDTWNLPLLCEGLNRALEVRRSGAPLLYRAGEDPEQFFFHFPGPAGAKAVVICAGGAYGLVWSPGEGYPVAARLNRMGYHAFVVNYRTGDRARAPGPMDDLAAALRCILSQPERWGADLSGYALMGFSAAGHLAGSFGTRALGWRHYGLARPGALVLCYPVVTMGRESEPSTRANLLGPDPSEALVRRYSLEEQVDPDYPPTFLWHCADDAVVPGVNSRMLRDRLTEAGAPHWYQSYPGTDHGTGLADDTAAEGWLEQAVSFWGQVAGAGHGRPHRRIRR